MRVLVTGSTGYVGSVLCPMLAAEGHDVVGVDLGWFADCTLLPTSDPVDQRPLDVRDLGRSELDGCDAVVHLAALSNDPLGDLQPELTAAINHEGSVRLGRLAKQAGVSRFLFASSCSLYGAAGDEYLDEGAEFNPITPYGMSKIRAEEDLSGLADDDFSPTYLRNATAYGLSPRLRGDLMVNNLVAHALLSGLVLMKSDGTPWRPLVHVEDMSRAFCALLRVDRDRIHDTAFNVGSTAENYQVRDVAELVQSAVPGSEIRLADGAGPDARNYRVSFEKIEREIPEFQPEWTVKSGVEQLRDALEEADVTLDQVEGDRFLRIRTLQRLLDSGALGPDLRPVSGVS